MLRLSALLVLFTCLGCVSPIRTRVIEVPKTLPCTLSTYTLTLSNTEIESEYQSKQERLKNLDAALQSKIDALGYKRLPYGESADLIVRYAFALKSMPANSAPDTVTMASDFPLGTLDISIATKQYPEYVIYHGLIQGLVGDVSTVNLKRLSEALDQAFARWPRCQ